MEQKTMKNLIFIAITALFISVIFAFSAFASITDGTIDNTNKYAWGENIGWINFHATNSEVHVTDAGLSGYALGENTGWIYLGNISNNGEGNLSGYAWGENIGWIKFNPTNGGAIINSSGEFTGSALGENTGWVIFNCTTSACVKTDWRPRSVRPDCNNSLDDDGDGKTDFPADPGCDSLNDNDETDVAPPSGGGIPAEGFLPPKSPEGGLRILINNNAQYTDTLTVNLNLFGGSDTAGMAISNFSDFQDAKQESYVQTKEWNLCQGLTSCPEGEYIVYAKFYTSWGIASGFVLDSIVYRKKPIIEKISEEVKEISEKAGEIAQKIVELFKPKPPEEEKPPEVPIEELVPKETPISMKNQWNLLTYTFKNLPFFEFTLAPLPKEIRNLAESFPQLKETLSKVGVGKLIDVEKLRTTKITLPGLTETVGLPTTKIEPGKFALPQGVPVAQLSPEAKEKIPTEIVFAKTGGELIDFNIDLSVTEKGKAEQKITTISGEPLNLTVKPEKPVKAVKGYIIFKAKKTEPSSFELPLDSLVASLFFANPIFAQDHNPEEIEEVLVLMEFEYTDPDGDGIYTADITAPLVEGEYEIITVMDYEDPDLGQKEIRLITVVDPEGYVYEKAGGKETRIPGAIVSLYWLNSETKQYELWPAKEYQQENPQVTDITGKYSFLVPQGSYYLKVEAPGYLPDEGKPFQTQEGSGIHFNIELKTKLWYLKILDWKTILLGLVILLLLYNFYRDKVREKIQRV
jgi:hypothetical protein